VLQGITAYFSRHASRKRILLANKEAPSVEARFADA